MQFQQYYRHDGEGRVQESEPSFSQPVSRPDMAGQPFPLYPYSGQPPVVTQNFYQAPPVVPPVMVDVQDSGPGWLVRALWFIFIGWWLGLIWLHIGFALRVTGIFLPVGLLMLNRLPTVLTLRRV